MLSFSSQESWSSSHKISHWSVCYTGNIIMIGPSEQELATTLDLLLRRLYARGWEINPTKIQEPSTSVKFLEFQGCRACWDIPSKVKDKLLHLPLPTTNKEAWRLVGFLDIGGNIFLILGVLLWLIYQVIWKAESFGLITREGSATVPGCCANGADIWVQLIQWFMKCQWHIGMLCGACKRPL